MAWPSTFANIQTAVIARLNLDATADLAATKDAINQAYSQAIIECEALQTSGTFTTTAGTNHYDLSSTLTNLVVRIKAIQITSSSVVGTPLRYVTLDEMLRLRVASGGASATSGSATHYTLNGMNDLELYPTPASVDTVTVWYAYQPTTLSADSDVPAIPEPYSSRLLTAGACAQMADYTGDPAGSSYQQDTELWTARFRAHLNRRRTAQPGSLIASPAWSWPPHDPSTDWGW